MNKWSGTYGNKQPGSSSLCRHDGLTVTAAAAVVIVVIVVVLMLQMNHTFVVINCFSDNTMFSPRVTVGIPTLAVVMEIMCSLLAIYDLLLESFFLFKHRKINNIITDINKSCLNS